MSPAGIADNVWEPAVYQHDFDNARMLGLNALRISIEWARIEPTRPTKEPNGSYTHSWDDGPQGAIQHYSDMVDAMIKRGLTPVITLNHFTLPLWALQQSKWWRQASVPAEMGFDTASRIFRLTWTSGDSGHDSNQIGLTDARVAGDQASPMVLRGGDDQHVCRVTQGRQPRGGDDDR